MQKGTKEKRSRRAKRCQRNKTRLKRVEKIGWRANTEKNVFWEIRDAYKDGSVKPRIC